MSLFDILGTILIGPLKLLFEVIFSIAFDVLKHPGPAIIVLSLVMNLLVLPLYRRADAIQMQARDTENKLKDTVAHIKKTFQGDERMMILQTYYRQNNYNPLSVLSGSVSLLLEIPFFMAAYQFLSGLDAFSGVSFGPIADLSAPDALLTVGSISINLLPFVMTLVNVISSALYLKGFPLKTKLQLYGMALFFLVFLYNSPSALVFYWTLNNLFSLVKTLVYKLIDAGGLKKLFKNKSKKPEKPTPKPNTGSFLLCGIFLTVLVGFLIPGNYIADSLQEYIDPNYFYSPIWYVVNTLCLSAGTFLVWMGVFYWLASPKAKIIFSRVLWIVCGVLLINYMFFGTKLGVVSPNLEYPDGFRFAVAEHIINIAVILLLSLILFFLVKKVPKVTTAVLLIGSLALTGMGIINTVTIVKETAETKEQIQNGALGLPSFSLNKDGKNVVVIMLDRGLGPLVPYILEEKPELKEQFDGFTYYANTLSYGAFTNFATPSLYGGYDYTPEEINLRDSESLVDKHNEALKVMPSVFSKEDFDVTMIDPSYAGYRWIPDLSIFEDIPGVTAYHADGKFNDLDDRIATVSARKRNFFFFSFMKTLPVSAQALIYDNGMYHSIPSGSADSAEGTNASFMNAYNVLDNLDSMTEVTDASKNTFMFLRSNLTHEPVLLQEPDFTPAGNLEYTPGQRPISDGEKTVTLNNENQLTHYHINMKAMLLLGEWFDHLRSNGVYDNTRIIIVADHGRGLGLFDQDQNFMHDIDFYRPMLLVKDFDAHGFTESDTFMTNADVPTLATAGLIEDPVNPFTGNPIDSGYKEENDRHYVIVSNDWDVSKNQGNQFNPSEWAAVSGEVGVKENWEFSGEATLFPPKP